MLYTYDDAIKATDQATDKVTTVCKLDFHPRCFKEAHNKIVAGGVISSINNPATSSFIGNAAAATATAGSGGQLFAELGDGNSGEGTSWRGLFSFFNRETQQMSSIRLGTYINNNASVNKVSNSSFKSFVCNNDKHLYSTHISGSQITVEDSVNLEFPLNHSALSDDHKNLVVLGDCSKIFLLHPGQQDGVLRRDNILDTPCDSGFSTSFSGSGRQFASCFQDGTCMIYDVRNVGAGPIKTIHSTRKNSSNGAFRCLKYSRGTDDLLIITEHVGRVHVIDSRDYSNHQVIVLPVNSIPLRSNQGSNISLSNMDHNGNERYLQEDDPRRNALCTPRVIDYNEVINIESNLSKNDESAPGFNPNYTSRNLNNFNLLNSIGVDEEYGMDIDSDLGYETSSLGRRHHRGSTSSTSSLTGSEFDYFDNEISGVDWYEDSQGSHVIIGCCKGLIKWNIDAWSRRSFPSFSML